MSQATEASVFIALGSNLQDPLAQMRRALAAIRKLPLRLLGQSSLYQTLAIGPGEQADYLNAVVQVATRLQPLALLTELQQIERQQGRQRTAQRWSARTLDLDILLFEERVCDDPQLTLPHPRMHERAFVLIPLLEIADSIKIPGQGAAKDLLATCHHSGVEKLALNW
ncbi:MAG: 2-amino-4-hydroxy-6-hydroxymethyldihydropteridine diphosphokinase [gamma proteobacterium symbiont of Bathyaustriella thionipta]|nr:2-amino-4-hydroxy-6-hydroxymethyldihydropteridine diphosphokinase [gamma proteobacterium symbiont of Bathyaustriella thionipta]